MNAVQGLAEHTHLGKWLCEGHADSAALKQVAKVPPNRRAGHTQVCECEEVRGPAHSVRASGPSLSLSPAHLLSSPFLLPSSKHICLLLTEPNGHRRDHGRGLG
jgi:hypothetical protein